MNALAYTDQWGKAHGLGPDSIRKPRTGIFAACIARGHILLSWPVWAPELPELPGGGIDPGESELEALCREIREEAAVNLPPVSPSIVHRQEVNYFCDSLNEFWDYCQTFWRLEGPAIDAAFFEGETAPEDALKARWVPLADLPNLRLHAMHERALKKIL